MKYILGGGITGLIFAYYNQDYTIITENIGGQMGSKFSLGPRYLHKTINAKSFLYSLQIPYSERVIRVGYVDDDGWVDSPDIKFREKYFMKSRGQKTLEGFDSSVMNNNQTKFTVLDIDFAKLIEKLDEKIANRIRQGRITSINTALQTFEIARGRYKEDFVYNHLVSSIPLSIFANSLENDHKLKEEFYSSYGMTYCLVEENDEFDTGQFDFVYDARESSKWHRMTKDGDDIVLDFFGELERIDLTGFVGDKYIAHASLPHCQIVSKKANPNIKNVKFIGRYGTWNRKWKTEAVIDDASAWAEKNKNS